MTITVKSMIDETIFGRASALGLDATVNSQDVRESKREQDRDTVPARINV